MRLATQADIPAMRAFLEARVETSMFLLGNLEAHGIGNTDHSHGTTYHLRETDAGITGVFGRTNGGFLTFNLPGLARPDARACADLLQGYALRGMTGEAEQVAVFRDVLPVPPGAWLLQRVEPLMVAELSGLTATEGETRQAAKADLPLLKSWFAPYMVETGFATPERAAKMAEDRAEAAVAAGNLHLLFEGEQPVAMAGINARTGAVVQVGGVYVPPGLRRQGRGGRVVAGLLRAQARAGASRAVLFAASDGATRVYERIGFRRIGRFGVAIMREPLTVGCAA